MLKLTSRMTTQVHLTLVTDCACLHLVPTVQEANTRSRQISRVNVPVWLCSSFNLTNPNYAAPLLVKLAHG